MDPDRVIVAAEEADTVSTTRWGRIWGLILFALIAGLVMWDLYTLWSMGIRQLNVRNVAELGRPWTEVETELREGEYEIKRGLVNIGRQSGDIFDSLTFQTTYENVIMVKLVSNRSTLEEFAIRVARRIVPNNWLQYYDDWKARTKYVRIVLDGDGKVRQVD